MTNKIEMATTEQSGLPATFESAYLLSLYQAVEREVSAEVPDVTTKEGRARIKSLAAKVSSSKTATDTPIRDYLRQIKALPKIIEANARENIERYDALKAKILEPLNEASREQEDQLAWLGHVIDRCNMPTITTKELDVLVEDIQAMDISGCWPEYAKKLNAAHSTALLTAMTTRDKKVQDEAREAELARLREEAAKREQEDRDRAIAEQAAAKARADEEARARRDREDADRRAAESRQREEQARMEAEAAKKRMAELEAKRKQEAEESQRQAEEMAQRAAQAARQAELDRQAKEKAEAERIAAAREADKANRVTKNRESLADLLANGLDEETAKMVITLIAQRKIRNLSIQY